jgi:hypothetical protein
MANSAARAARTKWSISADPVEHGASYAPRVKFESPLPRVAEYLAKLPRGVDSYPHTLVKGSVVRATIGDSALGSRLAPLDVPDEVAALLKNPPGFSDWVPEVHHAALICALFDAKFGGGGGGVPAFEAWTLEGNRKLLRGPAYRVMFLVVSPERILSGAQRRWEAFHKGSRLEMVKRARTSGQVRLTYPANLFSDLGVFAIASAFQAALEAAGAKGADVFARLETESSTLFEAAWEV